VEGRGTACLGKAWWGSAGSDRQGLVGCGGVRCGAAGRDRRVGSRHVPARQAWFGWAGHVKPRYGMARQAWFDFARPGLARFVMVRYGVAGGVWLGSSVRGPASQGTAGGDRQSMAAPGMARLGRQVKAWRGSVRYVGAGGACRGKSRHGLAGMVRLDVAGWGRLGLVGARYGSARQVGQGTAGLGPASLGWARHLVAGVA
jgi:hypothetical protein